MSQLQTLQLLGRAAVEVESVKKGSEELVLQGNVVSQTTIYGFGIIRLSAQIDNIVKVIFLTHFGTYKEIFP